LSGGAILRLLFVALNEVDHGSFVSFTMEETGFVLQILNMPTQLQQSKIIS